MASFDDALKNAVPGGNLATPIAVAVGALILGKLFGGGGSQPAPSPAAPPPQIPTSVPTNPTNSSVVEGLGGLLSRLTQGGAQKQVDSWVGHGPNEPIQPSQLDTALGGNILDQISARTGIPKDQLLNQLATALPQVVNSLTPKGRMPTLADLEER